MEKNAETQKIAFINLVERKTRSAALLIEVQKESILSMWTKHTLRYILYIVCGFVVVCLPITYCILKCFFKREGAKINNVSDKDIEKLNQSSRIDYTALKRDDSLQRQSTESLDTQGSQHVNKQSL